ncbi:hypothetical protein DRN97_02925 [Methanosarcinales archaeon]|nr:MAG: hypothetical protein DRN97_02925 [Methanosarcinales archaeon]
MSLLIPYVHLYNHHDPLFEEFTYGDAGKRGRKLKKYLRFQNRSESRNRKFPYNRSANSSSEYSIEKNLRSLQIISLRILSPNSTLRLPKRSRLTKSNLLEENLTKWHLKFWG